jgi:hypothetical protein
LSTQCFSALCGSSNTLCVFSSKDVFFAQAVSVSSLTSGALLPFHMGLTLSNITWTSISLSSLDFPLKVSLHKYTVLIFMLFFTTFVHAMNYAVCKTSYIYFDSYSDRTYAANLKIYTKGSRLAVNFINTNVWNEWVLNPCGMYKRIKCIFCCK